MAAYYNEFDPYAAQWLRNLITAGHIAPGVVDERSIEDVHPSDLRGFEQCHFFAGIGVWSLALRRAGWPDDRPVWTGSCHCQPFSQAGEGAGFDDERHLWPHFQWLIAERRPPVVFGEQVASRDAGPWIDLVQDDLEGMGYGVGAVAFPSAGLGAPHIRDRLYWVAHANRSTGRKGRAHVRGRADRGDAQPWAGLGGCGLPHGLADSAGSGSQGIESAGERTDPQLAAVERGCGTGGVAHHDSDRCEPRGEGSEAMGHRQATGADREPGGMGDTAGGQHIASGAWADQRAMAESHGAMQAPCRPTGPTNGLWRDADWLFCRDGKWRPVEPGTFPLAHGAPARVGRLRAYGNAINAQQAQIFIEAAMSCMP